MKHKTLFVSVLVLGFAAVAASGAIITVPGDFGTIQGAIDGAGVKGDEIVVSPGVYGEVINFGGKAIYLHSLSGDPADTIIDGTGLNESVVLCVSGEGAGTVLEGFTITGGTGHDDGFGDMVGGGMFIRNSSPTVINSVFIGNTAFSGAGGGMANSTSSPTVTSCIFSGNSALNGGGMVNDFNSSPIVADCAFIGNTAVYGGGMNNSNSSPTVTGCTFTGNISTGSGGGMSNRVNSSPVVINCVFSGNSSTSTFLGSGGGGMSNEFSSHTKVTNCTFIGNSASQRGGGIFNKSSNPRVDNCILLGNSPNEIFTLGTVTISFSNISGGLPSGVIDGGGNIDLDPLFIDADGADNIPGTADDDLRLGGGSPCIDAGDNAAGGVVGVMTDLDGLPRFVDDAGVADTGVGAAPIVDMGAYERQVNSCVADILPPGGDGVVDILDLMGVLNGFGVCGGPPAGCVGDITPAGPPVGNGVVNIDDLVAVLNAFGGCG